MAQKLTLFANDPNKEPDKQFEQIQTALLTVNSWANRINNDIIALQEQGVVGDTGPTGPQGPVGPSGAAGVVSGTYPIQYNSGTQTVSIANYYLPLGGGVMSGNIATATSGTNLIGASGTPFSGVWANEGHFQNLYGFSPITLHDDLVPVASGTIDIGTSAKPLDVVYANSISGPANPGQKVIYNAGTSGYVSNLRISGLSPNVKYKCEYAVAWSGTDGYFGARINNDSGNNYNDAYWWVAVGINGNHCTTHSIMSLTDVLQGGGANKMTAGGSAEGTITFHTSPVDNTKVLAHYDSTYEFATVGQNMHINGGTVYDGASAFSEFDLVATAGSFSGTVILTRMN